MKLDEIVLETFQNISMKGILYSLNSDEKKLYQKVKNDEKVFKKDLSEFMQRIANNLVTRGLLKRRKNPQSEIYFIARGRRKNAFTRPIEEVAPPDASIEKWINDNEERFQEKYGKQYKKYLYGKAWNKFNGKPLTESIKYKGPVYDDLNEMEQNIIVWRNPNPEWLNNRLNKNGSMRFFYNSPSHTLYVWDAELAVHWSVADTICVSYDILGELYSDGITVSEETLGSNNEEEIYNFVKEKMKPILQKIYGDKYENLSWGLSS